MRWRHLHVTWPSYLATHNTEQTLHFDADGLLRDRGALPFRSAVAHMLTAKRRGSIAGEQLKQALEPIALTIADAWLG